MRAEDHSQLASTRIRASLPPPAPLPTHSFSEHALWSFRPGTALDGALRRALSVSHFAQPTRVRHSYCWRDRVLKIAFKVINSFRAT